MFIIIHQQDKLPFRSLYSIIPQLAGIIPWFQIRIQVCNVTNVSCIMHHASCIKHFVYDKNHLKISKCLRLQTSSDILHILISSCRDDYTELHIKVNTVKNRKHSK
ncbi:MAG: hypothetical protein WC875_04560 [Candidatus Absconditabacterales bacterium]